MSAARSRAPRYFATPAALRAWFKRHHAKAPELLLGYWKVGSGRPSVTWPESVDEALCVGWIDGIRRRIDERRYTIRFTPRRPGSVWSRINVRRVAALIDEGRMLPAGIAVFEARGSKHKRGYSYSDRVDRFPAEIEAVLRAKPVAWVFFDEQPPGYKRNVIHWIVSARQEPTRLRRLATLIEDSAAGRRVGETKRYR